jgi:hypothetical protein
VLVLESARQVAKNESGLEGSYGKEFVGLEASVKDSSRFEGGWGFFDFTDSQGGLTERAQPTPDSAGCVACHRDRAATDHVFTQFYPVLRSAAGVL